MGQQIYQREAALRETIHRCDPVIEASSGFRMSDFFSSGKWQVNSSPGEIERRNIIMLTIFGLALGDLWRTYGIEPEGVAGVCSGEIAAAYVAGALSLEESAAVACSVADLVTQAPLKGHHITLDIEYEKAVELSRRAPACLDVNLEISPVTSMAYCALTDVTATHQFLTENGVRFRSIPCDWPYHTPRSADLEQSTRKLFVAKPQPLKCGFYSAMVGGLIHAGALLKADHWYLASISSGLFGRAISAALADGYDNLLNVSAFPGLKMGIQQTAEAMRQKITMLDSLRLDEAESHTWERTYRSLSASGFVRARRPSSENDQATARPTDESSGISLLRPDVVQDPYPHYATLRSLRPVHYLSAHGFWLVLNYADVAQALKQTSLFSNSPGAQLDSVLVGADPPAHTRARRILTPYFSVQSIQTLEDYTRFCAEKLLSEGREQREFDLVNGLAIPLTERVVGHFLGLSDEEVSSLRQKLRPHKYQLDVTSHLLEDWARDYVSKAHHPVGEDLGSKLSRGHNGEAFQPEEIVSVMKLLWLAGTTTTSMLISTSVLLLLQHADIRKAVQEDLSLLPSFVEEALRLDAPEQMAWRIARTDVEISGVKIPTGAEVRLSLGAANRDPEHFTQPDELLLQRTPNDHLSFAAGPHYCLGASLARMEARVALAALFTEWPDFRAARHLATREYSQSFHFRALKSLYVAAS